MYKAFKFRLYPTKERAILINQSIGSSRKEADAHALQSSLRNLDDAFQGFFKKQKDAPRYMEEWKRELTARYTCLEEVAFACECGHVQTVHDFVKAGKPEHKVCTECLHCHKTSDQQTTGGRLVVQRDGFALPIFDFATEKTNVLMFI